MKKLFFENVGLKISAILLSVFLWLFVTSRGQSEISLEAPLEVKGIPAGLGVVSNSAKTVVVTIRGQERLMKNVRPSDIRVFIDLGKAKKGEGAYYINKDDIKLPYAMSVMNITPSSIKIRLDETISKPVAVIPSVSGVPEKGFYIRAVEVEPRSIIIQGLKSEVRKIIELRTEVMDVTGMTDTTTQELNIDTVGANIRPEINMVKVKVVITGRKR